MNVKYCIVLIGLVGLTATAPASRVLAQDDSAATKFFESKIRPILVKHCYECHSNESGKSKGGLKVDSRDSLRRGGDTGPAIVPRSLSKSILYRSITHEGDYQMPPKGKLPASVIDDFRKWISMGAPDPRRIRISPSVNSTIDIKVGKRFWAYQSPKKTNIPSVGNNAWPRSDIDRFVLSKLEQEGLQPVHDADTGVLVRRMYFVLTGLPPRPEDLVKWTSEIDASKSEEFKQKALEKLVDQLLDSQQFGERWGRHWLDVARFAESTGGDQNNIFQHAWRYRDWVINSFNSDKPFDDFVREQLAGDLLPIANDLEWANNIVATGFLAIGVKLVGEEDQQKYFADLVDEQIDATSRAFLGTSVACARCHDHKFDPIPQSDYYALAGIFRSTQTHYGLLQAQARQATTLLDLTGLGLSAGSSALNEKKYNELVEARDKARKAVDDAMKKIRSGENVFRGALRRMRSVRDETEAALQGYAKNGQPKVFVMGTQDREFPLTTRLLVRGELNQPAQIVTRGIPQVLASGRYQLPTNAHGSGRLELANWIASNRNPLTARVMANRIWHWMFGRGIVRTVDDFGSTGDLPTHPELLDYLAIRFTENGWSTKKLIREIALSRAWRLASTYDETSFAKDPDNRFFWRANKRRLESESIRDAMLAVGGNLEKNPLQGTLLRDVGEGNVGQNVFEPVIRALDSNHRSVYLPRVRGALPEILELFDSPDASLVAGARESSASPLQSLFLMNNEFVQRQSEGFASQLADLPESSRVERAYQLAFSRLPNDSEKKLAAKFMSSLDRSSLNSMQKLAAYCQALFCAAEFGTID